MKTPKFKLMMTNHGTDGWDAKTAMIARFNDLERAQAYLASRGYTFYENGNFEHQDHNRRHCMGKITYAITADEQVPENPE